MATRRASCTCGQLTVEVEGDPVRISICHCLACQRRTGSVFGTQARWPREQVRIEGYATECVRISDEGEERSRFSAVVGRLPQAERLDRGLPRSEGQESTPDRKCPTSNGPLTHSRGLEVCAALGGPVP